MRSSGRVVHGTKPGPKPYLSNEQGVSPGPSATVSPCPSTPVSPGPLNTVPSAVAGPSNTVISVAASSFHQKGKQARGGISSSPQGTTPTSMKTLPQARLLTSSDLLAEMEEKGKKKLALEEMAHRKTEREVKQKHREEEQKQKAEEREKKAEERAKKVKDAANKKTRLRLRWTKNVKKFR